jgi:hypothetical protein
MVRVKVVTNAWTTCLCVFMNAVCAYIHMYPCMYAYVHVYVTVKSLCARMCVGYGKMKLMSVADHQ